MKIKQIKWLILGIVLCSLITVALFERNPVSIVEKSWKENSGEIQIFATINNSTEETQEKVLRVIVEKVSDGKDGARPIVVSIKDFPVELERRKNTEIARKIIIPLKPRGRIYVSFQLVQPVAGGDATR